MTGSPSSSQAIAAYSANPTESVVSQLNPFGLVSNLWLRRGLIWQFTVREVQGRYKGSYLGVFWAMLNPLMMLAVFTFVFHSLLGQRWDPKNPNENFMVYAMHMFIRIIAWNLFAESVIKAPILITSNPNYVKKVVFPLEVLPLSLIGSALFHSALSLIVLFIGAATGAGAIQASLLFLPLAYLPLLLLSAGICWFLAALGVFLRDIGHVISVVVQLLFFLTPITYPPSRLPLWARMINPMALITDNFGRVVNDGLPPDWREWTLAMAIAVVMALCGYAFFMKIKRAFADVI